jgi:hypothetical protein
VLTGVDAANDVHCAVRVCAALTRLAKERGIPLDLVKLGVAVTGTAGAEPAALETAEPEAMEEDVDLLAEEVLTAEAPAAEAPAPAPAGGRTLTRTPSVSTVLQGMSLAAPAQVYARMRTPPTLPFIFTCNVHNYLYLTRILRLHDQGAGRMEGKCEG